MGIQVSNSVASYIGLAASRPAANTVPIGAIFFSTDTGVASRSDGQTWTTIPVGSGALANDSVGAAQIAAGAVGASELAAGAVGIDKMAGAQIFTASGNISASGSPEVLLATSTANQTLKLPAAIAGLAYTISTSRQVSSMTLQRSDAPGTDTFDGGVTSIQIYGKSVVKVWCTTNGTWQFLRREGDPAGSVTSDVDDSGSGDVANLQLALPSGDGIHAIRVTLSGYLSSTGSTSANAVKARVYTGAGATGAKIAHMHNYNGGTAGNVPDGTNFCEGIVTNYTGATTLYVNLTNDLGTPRFMGASVHTTRLVARWTMA